MKRLEDVDFEKAFSQKDAVVYIISSEKPHSSDKFHGNIISHKNNGYSIKTFSGIEIGLQKGRCSVGLIPKEEKKYPTRDFFEY